MLEYIKKIEGRWIFFLLVLLLVFVLILLDYPFFLQVFFLFGKVLIKVAPALIMVFLLMFFSNFLIRPELITKYLGESSGLCGWLIAILGGIVSSGPIYMWYPLLSDLKEKGVSQSFIAAFLYSRAVKIPLMPLMAFYFGWGFVAVFTTYLVIFSAFNGWLVEKMTSRLLKNG